MKNRLLQVAIVMSLLMFGGLFSASKSPVQAACPSGYTCSGGCTYIGQCINNKKCSYQPIYGQKIIAPGTEECGSAVIGGVKPPEGVRSYNFQAVMAGNGDNIGILIFASKLLKIANIIAGLLIFTNFVSAGYAYVTSAGNTSIMAEIKDKLTFSIIGIIIIVAAYAGMAIFSYILFGDPGFLLNPDLTKYGALANP